MTVPNGPPSNTGIIKHNSGILNDPCLAFNASQNMQRKDTILKEKVQNGTSENAISVPKNILLVE